MSRYKVQGLRELRDEMKAVARGTRQAPEDAAAPSFNSVEALVRLLTPENRRLLALIRDRKPRSVSDLAAWTGRAQPNISRTLSKLEAAGMVAMTDGSNRRKVPLATVRKITIEIDPYDERDRLQIA